MPKHHFKKVLFLYIFFKLINNFGRYPPTVLYVHIFTIGLVLGSTVPDQWSVNWTLDLGPGLWTLLLCGKRANLDLDLDPGPWTLDLDLDPGPGPRPWALLLCGKRAYLDLDLDPGPWTLDLDPGPCCCVGRGRRPCA